MPLLDIRCVEYALLTLTLTRFVLGHNVGREAIREFVASGDHRNLVSRKVCFSIPVAQIKQEGFIDMTNTLLDIKKGELQVQLQYCQLVPAVNPATVEDMEEPLKIDVAALTERSSSEITEFFGTTNNGVQATQPFNQCYINVFVDSATNLPRNHPTDLRAYPSPYVKITIPGFAGEKQTTIIKDMSNPVWEECFDFLANNTGDKTIKFEVFDSEKNTQT